MGTLNHEFLNPLYHRPWQNGRIERFFGTFKAHIRQILIEDAVQLDK